MVLIVYNNISIQYLSLVPLATKRIAHTFIRTTHQIHMEGRKSDPSFESSVEQGWSAQHDERRYGLNDVCMYVCMYVSVSSGVDWSPQRAATR